MLKSKRLVSNAAQKGVAKKTSALFFFFARLSDVSRPENYYVVPHSQCG